MIDVPPAPSPLPKTLNAIARWALGLTLTAWFVFGATWAALHWLIVPRIDALRPWLEARASQVIGVPVHIGAIKAQTVGMIPSFELTDVALFDAQGRAALRLPRVLAALSPASMWRLGFEQLYIDRPELSIRRDRNGRIFVAGLDFSKNGEADPGAADWFFSQLEFVIHDGKLEWTDEMRDAPPLALAAVDIVLRNKGRRHDMRIDATPPVLWGSRLSLRGMFEQPLLSLHKGQWGDWKGQLYAELGRVDLSELRRYAPLGVDLHQGNGALTAWVDVSRGQFVAAQADVALGEVSVTLGKDLKALDLLAVRGRLGGKLLASGFEFSTQGLQFDTRDGLHWPGGNVNVSYLGAEGRVPARGEFRADKLDLGALAQIANRLPLEPGLRAKLQSYAPKGLVERLQVKWQGSDWSQYDAKGLVSRLEVELTANSPGVHGAAIEFDFNQSAGRASVGIANGSLSVPGIFDEPLIPVAQLSTELRWQISGEHIALQLPNLKFSNADAQGEAQIKWETSDPAKSAGRKRFPGVLDLQATLSRGDGTRVYRYLPTVIGRPVRDYVHDAIQAGTVSAARFRVRGDLHDMPFTYPKLGEFRISADVQNASYVYVPRKLQPKDALPWPALTQLSGELVFDRAALQVKGARARIGASASLQANKVEALIPDLKHAVVAVSADVRGPLGEALGIVNGSPLAALTGHALARAVASASADYRLKLSLPIATIEKSTVHGSVTLAGNDIQMTPDTPRMTRSRGVVNFSDHDFSLSGAQATVLGGDMRLEGGSVAAAASGPVRSSTSIQFRASGTATAEGLRQARELGFVARLAQHASGSAAYTAVLGFRRGEPELLINSNLQGFGLSLPAPFVKSTESVMPLRVETALLRESLLGGPSGPGRLRDQLTLELGRLASLAYVRDVSGAEPRVLRGSLAIGLSPSELAPMPDEGVAANISLGALDLDAWRAVLAQAAGSSVTDSSSIGYLPSSVAVRAQELTLGGRKFSNIVVGGSRDGQLWRANLDASELNGYLEYRAPSGAGAGRIYARLGRLTIAANAASEVEALLNDQPASVPALDIAVEDFELRGKRLGRIEIEAINRGPGTAGREASSREWRLNKFNIINPDAVFTASGNWAGINAQGVVQGAAAARSAPAPRRTVLNFKLDMVDGGGLLARFGMKDVVRKGRGKMEGQVAWLGSPLSLDYASMSGAFTVNVESGQFLKADPGIAKLLGVLSLQSLPRRLTLDFRDVFSDGFVFDFLRGDVAIEHGIAKTNNLQMQGVNAAVLMDGKADLAQETQDIKVVVVPEINAGTASLIASVINPAIGLGTFLAQLFLRRPLIEAATQEFHIDGSWADPKISKIERKAAGAAKTGEPGR